MFKLECDIKILISKKQELSVGPYNCKPCTIGNYKLTNTSLAQDKNSLHAVSDISNKFAREFKISDYPSIPSFFNPIFQEANKLYPNEMKTCKFIGLFDFNPNMIFSWNLKGSFNGLVNLNSELVCGYPNNSYSIKSSPAKLEFFTKNSESEKGIFEQVSDKLEFIINSYFLKYLKTMDSYYNECDNDFTVEESDFLYKNYKAALPKLIADQPITSSLETGTLIISDDRDIETNLDLLVWVAECKKYNINPFQSKEPSKLSFGNELVELNYTNYKDLLSPSHITQKELNYTKFIELLSSKNLNNGEFSGHVDQHHAEM